MFGNKKLLDLLRRVVALEQAMLVIQHENSKPRNELEHLTQTFNLFVEYAGEKFVELQDQIEMALQQLTQIDESHPPLIQELLDKVSELRMDVNSYRMELLAPSQALVKPVPAGPAAPLTYQVPQSVLSEIHPEPQSSRVVLVKDDITAWLRTSYGVKHTAVEVDFDTEVAAQAFRLSERRFREYLNMLARAGVVEPIGRGRSRLPTYGRIRIHPAKVTR